MAISESYSSSATVSTTEYSLPNASTTLATVTTDGIYQVFLDASNMAAGDQYRLQVYEKVTSGGSKRVVSDATLSGVQAGAYVTPTLILMHGWDVTLTKLAGTDRVFSWSIRRVA